MTPQERREHFKINLNPFYLEKYKILCSILSLNWAPYSGFRTFAEQDSLFINGEVRAAAPGQSAHNYGCATDWTWFDDSRHLIWLKPEDTKWNEYVDAVNKSGLKSGQSFGDIDHNELKIKVPWTSIYLVYKMNGSAGVLENIKKNS